jgi:hypothetical protein
MRDDKAKLRVEKGCKKVIREEKSIKEKNRLFLEKNQGSRVFLRLEKLEHIKILMLNMQ